MPILSSANMTLGGEREQRLISYSRLWFLLDRQGQSTDVLYISAGNLFIIVLYSARQIRSLGEAFRKRNVLDDFEQSVIYM